MKKILLSLLTIALLTSVTVGATRAYYSDTADLTGVTFSTGDANLKISQSCMHSWYENATLAELNSTVGNWCKFNLNPQPWYPGMLVHQVLFLGNFSTSQIQLNPTVQLSNFNESIDGLQDVMWMKIWWSGSAEGTGWHTLRYYKDGASALAGIPYPSAQPPSYGNGGVLGLNIDLKMDEDAGDEYESGTLGFDFHFNAEQAH